MYVCKGKEGPERGKGEGRKVGTGPPTGKASPANGRPAVCILYNIILFCLISDSKNQQPKTATYFGKMLWLCVWKGWVWYSMRQTAVNCSEINQPLDAYTRRTRMQRAIQYFLIALRTLFFTAA